jgi:hypothetical protein
MINLLKLVSVLFVILIVGNNASAQKADTTQVTKPVVSPYDLMSKYYNDNFHPFLKGAGYFGLAFSLQDQSLENTQRLLDKVVDGDKFEYNIELKGGYFIGNYVMAGVNFQYSYDKFIGTVVKEGDTIQSNSLSRKFVAMPVLKTYFPVTSSERLSFFTEIGLGFGGGNTLKRDIKNEDEITKTYASDFIFSMGLTPGITFFAMENFAFEVGINVIGYTLRRTTSTVNNIEQANEIRHNVNLNINLLSLKLGLAYYFK